MKNTIAFFGAVCFYFSCYGVGNGIVKETKPDIVPNLIKVNLNRTNNSDANTYFPVVHTSPKFRIDYGSFLVPTKIQRRVEELCEDDDFWEEDSSGLYYGYDVNDKMSYMVDAESTLVKYIDGNTMVEYTCEYDDTFGYIIVQIDDLKKMKTYVLNRDTYRFRSEEGGNDILMPKYDAEQINEAEKEARLERLKEKLERVRERRGNH